MKTYIPSDQNSYAISEDITIPAGTLLIGMGELKGWKRSCERIPPLASSSGKRMAR